MNIACRPSLAVSTLLRLRRLAVLALLALGLTLPSQGALAQQVTAFMQAVAEASSRDKDIAAFYRANGYQAIWTGRDDAVRRKALLVALSAATDHGLPAYDTELLRANMAAVKSDRDLGRIEVELSRLFLDYAGDIQTGVLIPRQIDPGLLMQVPYRDRAGMLASFAKSSPAAFLKKLAPDAPEYLRLMKAKFAMEKTIGRGGWGPRVPAKELKPGQSGEAVVAMRNRLIGMGYLGRSAANSYDGALQQAVQRFQLAHGLSADGVAGAGTMAEINVEPEQRLASILVAMERERWMNSPRGKRYIWVNLADFTAKVFDNDKLTFETRSVVGANDSDRRSPEFSDMMEHMVINPTWNVPRSIAVKEYLPMMQKNPNAAGHLRILDGAGRSVPRSAIDFTQFTPANFPFDLKQPPSDGNALGKVKFMFPNPYNIYLHDTPAKNLFGREVRAYSHGCIRLNDPFDFAYVLLRKQMSNPEEFFHDRLATGSENAVMLDEQVPVHLVYRTAFTGAKGELNFRRDIYGRDARIFAALQKAGVALRAVQG